MVDSMLNSTEPYGDVPVVNLTNTTVEESAKMLAAVMTGLLVALNLV